MLPSLQPQVMLAVIQFIRPMWSLQLIPTPVYQCLSPVLLSEPGNWTPCFLSCRCPGNAFSMPPLWCFNIQTRLPFSMFKILWQHPIPHTKPTPSPWSVRWLWFLWRVTPALTHSSPVTLNFLRFFQSVRFFTPQNLALQLLGSCQPCPTFPWLVFFLTEVSAQANIASSGMAFLHTFS